MLSRFSSTILLDLEFCYHYVPGVGILREKLQIDRLKPRPDAMLVDRDGIPSFIHQ